MDRREIARFTRSFELITELRMLKHRESSIYRVLPKIIAGFIEYQFLPYYYGGVPGWRLWLRRASMQKRVLPDFAMVAPIKSGSSDLVSHLMTHPNIIAPLAKEIFSPEPATWLPYYPTVPQKQRAERRLGVVRTGYLSPYLHWLRLTDNLHAARPDAKIIITLRDPVERAYSHWKWEILIGGREGREDPYFREFSDFIALALDLFPAFPMVTHCGFPVLETGIYHKAVELWMQRFGRDQVLVLDVAEYFQNRSLMLRRVQEFLELAIVELPEHDRPINENPLKLAPPDEATNSALSHFYRPFNEKLFTLLGKRFDWR